MGVVARPVVIRICDGPVLRSVSQGRRSGTGRRQLGGVAPRAEGTDRFDRYRQHHLAGASWLQRGAGACVLGPCRGLVGRPKGSGQVVVNHRAADRHLTFVDSVECVLELIGPIAVARRPSGDVLCQPDPAGAGEVDRRDVVCPATGDIDRCRGRIGSVVGQIADPQRMCGSASGRLVLQLDIAVIPLRHGIVGGVGHPERQGLLSTGGQRVGPSQQVGVGRTVVAGVEGQTGRPLHVAHGCVREPGQIELVGDLQVGLVDCGRGTGCEVVRRL